MTDSKAIRSEIGGATILRGIVIGGSVAACFIFLIVYSQTNNWIVSVALTIVFILFVFLRAQKDRNGWYMEECSGLLRWYEGSIQGELDVSLIRNIDFNAVATLDSGQRINLPMPCKNFLPFYKQLFEKYPYLFDAERVLNPTRH
jgi:hypothetical protein